MDEENVYTEWDFNQMTPQALATVKSQKDKPACKHGKHSPGWYVGYACALCGDID